MSNGYIGGPAYPQPYVDGGGTINAYKWYVTTVDIYKDEWKRPEYWLSLPNLVQGDQRFCGLHGVFKGASGNTGGSADSNFVALMIRLQNTGHSYFVDWGDGNVTRHAHNTNAQYEYNWANIDSSTETPEGYKQVVIQAYPQTGGTMTMLDLRPGFSRTGLTLSNLRSSGWLDIRVAGSELNTMYIGQYATANFRNWFLSQVHVVGTTKINNPGIFISCQGLRKIIGSAWTSNITDATWFMGSCTCLEYIPLLDTRKMTSWIYFVMNTRRLRRFPPLDCSKVTNFQQTFMDESGAGNVLLSLPILNTSNVTVWGSTFQRQRALKTIPNLDFSKATTLGQVFSQNGALEKIPNIVAPNATNLGSMFSNCFNLKEISGICAPNATSVNSMFSNCYSLKNVPEINTSKVTDFRNMLNGCFSIEKVPDFDTSSGTLFDGMMFNTSSLGQIPILNLNGASAGSTAAGAGPLLNMMPPYARTGTMLNTRRSVSYANMILSATELNSIFTNLADVSGTGATITITNTWGSATCNRTIATSKGWTVIG
jgi:hypothetical protein